MYSELLGDGGISSGTGKFVHGDSVLDAVYSKNNVGIGINNPSEKLEVSGTIKADDFILADGSTLGRGKFIDGANASDAVFTDSNVGIGTTSPDQKLAVNGSIRSKEVLVEASGWPDFVFAKDYDLPTLTEVENP